MGFLANSPEAIQKIFDSRFRSLLDLEFFISI